MLVWAGWVSSTLAGSSKNFSVGKANFNVSELRGSSGKAERGVSHFTDGGTRAREEEMLAKCVRACMSVCVYVHVFVFLCVCARRATKAPGACIPSVRSACQLRCLEGNVPAHCPSMESLRLS